MHSSERLRIHRDRYAIILDTYGTYRPISVDTIEIVVCTAAAVVANQMAAFLIIERRSH